MSNTVRQQPRGLLSEVVPDLNLADIFGTRDGIKALGQFLARADAFKKRPSVHLNRSEEARRASIVPTDACPLTFGIETTGSVSIKIIPHNTIVPTGKSQMFFIAADNQSTVTIQVSKVNVPLRKPRQFKRLNNDPFRSSLKSVERVLEDTTMKQDIADVVILGGSTRIPNIQPLLKDFFNGILAKQYRYSLVSETPPKTPNTPTSKTPPLTLNVSSVSGTSSQTS
ncbi:ATPase with role in protein import into the ER, partial [Tulasnella sp. 408]